MPLFTAEALVVFDFHAKTFTPDLALPWAVAHELRGIEATTPDDALERVWIYSNHEGRLCGYDGPSLSVGDMVRLQAGDEVPALYRCAVIGFEDITSDLATVERARVAEPERGTYRPPVYDLAAGRLIAPGDSWRIWL